MFSVIMMWLWMSIEQGQLRARLLAQHLRHPKDDLMQPKKRQRKPSLIERLLSSLFLDYLEANAFTFTVSVFMPESQMSSWPPFSYQEMLELLHFDPSSDLHTQLVCFSLFSFLSCCALCHVTMVVVSCFLQSQISYRFELMLDV